MAETLHESAVEIVNHAHIVSVSLGAATRSTGVPADSIASNVRSNAASISGSTSLRNVRTASTLLGLTGKRFTPERGTERKSPRAAPRVTLAS